MHIKTLAILFKRIKLIVIFIFFIILNFNLLAANYTIAGCVFYKSLNESLPFANLSLFVPGDSVNIIKGTVSDDDGKYILKNIEPGKYILKVSYIGLETLNREIDLKEDIKNQNFILDDKSGDIEEVIIKGKRVIRKLNKKIITFSDNQIKECMQVRDLVATIPNLYVNEMNIIATINSKSLLILLNGIPANDNDLKLIPPNKIKNVEYFDVPPVRYANSARIVINVRTYPLDNGLYGSVEAMAGQMYYNTTDAFSYIKGNNKFTISYDGQLNPKLNKRNTEEGIYEYIIDDEDYIYEYDSENISYGIQNSFSLAYLNSKDDDYTFNLRFSGDYNDLKDLSNKNIVFDMPDFTENTTGYLKNKVKTLSPRIDIYYSKKISDKSKISTNLVGTYFDNDQHAVSYESGSRGYDDLLDLKSKKKSIIGEVVYEYEKNRISWSAGYKGNFNFLDNKIENSFQTDVNQNIHTQRHYLYGQATTQIHDLWIQISAAGTYDVRFGDDGFNNLRFTPNVTLGYNINDDNELRFNYSSYTGIPDIQQTSESKVLVMNGIFRSGNPGLINSHSHNLAFMYSFSYNNFGLESNLYYHINNDNMFMNYIDKGDFIEMRPENADKDETLGIELDIDYRFLKYFRIGTSIDVSQKVFRPISDGETYRIWSAPPVVYLKAKYKSWNFSYFQKFGGKYINGLYREGIEKVSYLSLGYGYKNLYAGAMLLFPFIEDKCSNDILDGTLVKHHSNSNYKIKNKALQLSLSWYFHSGKQKSDNKSIDNKDKDNGSFKIK